MSLIFIGLQLLRICGLGLEKKKREEKKKLSTVSIHNNFHIFLEHMFNLITLLGQIITYSRTLG